MAGGHGQPSTATAKKRARMMTGFKDTQNKLLPLHGPLKDLGRGGVGVELFFRTIRWSIILFSTAFVVSIPSLVDNVRWVNQNLSAEERSPLVVTMHGDRADEEAEARITSQGAPALIITVFCIGAMYFLRYKQRTVAKLVDRRFITTGDYAVEVRGVPHLADVESKLLVFFSQFGEVAQVAVGYHCADYVQALNKWKKADVQRAEERAQGDEMDASKVAEIEREMRDLEKEMQRLQHTAKTNTGAAFVIFNTEAGRRQCMNAFHLEWYQLLFDACAHQTPRFENRWTFTVRPAPEPTDVYWENLEVGPRTVQLRSFRTLLVTAVIVGLTALVLVEFTQARDREIERLQQESPARASLYARTIVLVAAAVVTGVNSVIKVIVMLLTQYERHDTRTDYEESLFIKLSLAYIFTQSLLILFVSWNRDTWFVNGGVFNQAFFIILANAVVPEALKNIRFDLWARRFIMAAIAKSQARLDEAWQPPAPTIGEFYAGFTKTIALGLIYGPGWPLVWLLTAVALAISYGSNKFCLLRVTKQPPSINEGLSEKFRLVLSWIILASLILQHRLYAPHTAYAWVGTGFWIFYKVFPLKFLPCLRLYVDLDANDTGGVTFSSSPGLPKYLCPVSAPVPSIDDHYRRQPSAVQSIFDDARSAMTAAGAAANRTLEQLHITGAAKSGSQSPLPPIQHRPGPPGPGVPPQSFAPSSGSYSQPYPSQPPRAPLPPVQQDPGQYGQPPPQQYQDQYAHPPERPPPQQSPGQYQEPQHPQPQQYPGQYAPSHEGPVAAPPALYQPMLLSVQCPVDVGPGAQIIVEGPGQQYISVIVPNNVVPGQIFHVSV